MNEHPDRRAIVEEMHLRRWPALKSPISIVQVLRLVEPGERDLEYAAVATPANGKAATINDRQITGTLGGAMFIWERHSEASTLAVFCQGSDELPPLSLRVWAETLPGQIVRATSIIVLKNDDEAIRHLPSFAFLKEELVSCHIGAKARFWSDFRIGPEGYGRIVIAANGEDPSDLGRIVQRLQELGNYRNLALLGLPKARDGWQDLDSAEELLASVGPQFSEASVRDDVLFEKLTALSLRISAITNETRIRMAATAAYAQLVEDRLFELSARPVESYQSLADFTQRRFLPAIRTCARFDQRSQQLNDAAARMVSLLRARIEARIENQNAVLLLSLERSASRQLRLQQLVEGFSVLAISYYAMSICKFMIEASHIVTSLHIDAKIIGLSAPFFLGGTWMVLHYLRSSALKKA